MLFYQFKQNLIFLLLCLLKNVEIVIIDLIGEGILRQKVLKALANPPRIFYVPYTVALLNFLFWFFLFVFAIVIFTVIPPHEIPMWLPLLFLGILSLCHTILAFYSKKDPQISQIIFSNLRIIKNRIPKKLAV